MRMRHARFTGTLLALLLVSCLIGTAVAAASYSLPWDVVSGGGSHAAGGVYTLRATLGQPMVGSHASGSSFALCSGFWCGVSPVRLYLPLVLRGW